jgi:ribonuclease HIII
MKTAKISSYSVKLTEEKIKILEDILRDKEWSFKNIPYAYWGASPGKGLNVVAYKSGKVTVQGKDTEEFVLFTLEPQVTGKALLGYESGSETGMVKQVELSLKEPHAGIDESGKGDFFGPLVIAAVYVDEKTEKILENTGVQDSKLIKNDKKIIEIAKKIKKIVGNSYSVVPIGPDAYNRLYGSMQNLNKLLAWGHARALENLLAKVPECKIVIADKFAHEREITGALMKKGKDVKLIQRTKAESDIAVAAASILARAEFVFRLSILSEEAGVNLPKGAGAGVNKVIKILVEKYGKEKISSFGKTHFKSLSKVLAEM